SRDRIGDAETTAQILQRVAERVERCNHVWPRLGERVHVAPFGDDAIAAVAGLDHVDALQAGPIGLYLFVRIEKLLVASGLHPKAHRIERRHTSPHCSLARECGRSDHLCVCARTLRFPDRPVRISLRSIRATVAWSPRCRTAP